MKVRQSITTANPRYGQRGVQLDSVGKTDVMLRIGHNFAKWDLDDSGHITWSELRKNVADPDIEGRDAAALATLYSLVQHDAYERDLVRMPSLHYTDIFNMQADYLESEEEPLADKYYKKYIDKLENASNKLFPEQMANAFQVAQGVAPSCGFLATTFAQAQKDPSSVREAITVRDDGKLSVKFPGKDKAVVIAPSTDTETALHASASHNGAWLNNLEKAWGTLQGKNPEAAFEQTTWPEDAIEAWTGGKATTARIPKKPSPVEKGELPHYLRTVHRELAANHLAVTWSRYEGLEGLNLVPGHAYTLRGIDKDEGTVELRNPWGHREPSDQDGQPLDGRDDGVFELTFDQFARAFSHIARQTD